MGQGVSLRSYDPISHHIRKDCSRVGSLPVVRGDDTTESRLAHSHSSCREGDHHGLIRSIRHCHSNRSGELFQQGMAACSNGPKQVCIRHLDEPGNLCWRVFTRTLGYATVSFALTSFRWLAKNLHCTQNAPASGFERNCLLHHFALFAGRLRTTMQAYEDLEATSEHDFMLFLIVLRRRQRTYERFQ